MQQTDSHASNAIRAVILDLGNVVLPFEHVRAFRAAARHSPLPADEICRRVWSGDLIDRFDRGDMTWRTFAAAVRRLIDYQGTPAQLRRAWVEIFRPYPAMERLIEQLAERYPLVLLSNTNRAHFEHAWRTYPIVRTFRRRVLSYDVNLLKPDPRIYRLAADKTGCPAEACVYVDDKPEYARAAGAVGTTGIAFRGARLLRRDLKRLGLHLT